MSKRYGRQQKRRARERIAKLEEALERSGVLSAELSHKNKEQKRTIDLTARVLGKYFLTLPPESIEVREMERFAGHWRMPAERLVESTDFSCDQSPAPLRDFLHLVLPILEGRQAQVDLQNKKHLVFSYGKRKVGYAISEFDLAQLPRDEAVRRISEAMAEHLINELGGSTDER